MHFSLVKITSADSPAVSALDDCILPIYHGLFRLGFAVEKRTDSVRPDTVNILFCAGGTKELEALDPPANSIVYNLQDLKGRRDDYAERIARFTVWDYSPRNVALLASRAVYIRPGYVPEMTRLAPDWPTDIPLLLLRADAGQKSLALAEALQQHAHATVVGAATSGLVRDYLLARAALVCLSAENMLPGLFLACLGYLWANGKAVIAPNAYDIPAELADASRFAAPDALIAAAASLADAPASCRALGARALRIFSSMRQETTLEKIVGRKIHANAFPPLPQKLNAGSGMDFMDDFLNIDIQTATNPDLVLDLSLPLCPEAEHTTKRFGPVRLTPGGFTHIIANEVLEHVADLPQTMRNFLDLLAFDGILECVVPYELSTGAWQDPTHVRVFNEISFCYFSTDAWYMNWRDERFELVSQNFILTPLGRKLEAEGTAMDDILRIPRAVRHMKVVLRKRAATHEEQMSHDLQRRSFYKGAVGEWTV